MGIAAVVTQAAPTLIVRKSSSYRRLDTPGDNPETSSRKRR